MVCQAEDVAVRTEPPENSISASAVVLAVAPPPIRTIADHRVQQIAQPDWRLAPRLGICFAAPIIIMIVIVYWANNRVLSVDHAMDLATENRLTKLQWVHQAARYSNENNAIANRLPMAGSPGAGNCESEGAIQGDHG